MRTWGIQIMLLPKCIGWKCWNRLLWGENRPAEDHVRSCNGCLQRVIS